MDEKWFYVIGAVIVATITGVVGHRWNKKRRKEEEEALKRTKEFAMKCLEEEHQKKMREMQEEYEEYKKQQDIETKEFVDRVNKIADRYWSRVES